MNVALHGQCALERAHSALVHESLSTALRLAAEDEHERPTVRCPPTPTQQKRWRHAANARARLVAATRAVLKIITSAAATIPAPPLFPAAGDCCRGKWFHEGSCVHYSALGTWRDRGAT
jgi:hypothetical protein